jgi:hypothetical protein
MDVSQLNDTSIIRTRVVKLKIFKDLIHMTFQKNILDFVANVEIHGIMISPEYKRIMPGKIQRWLTEIDKDADSDDSMSQHRSIDQLLDDQNETIILQ